MCCLYDVQIKKLFSLFFISHLHLDENSLENSLLLKRSLSFGLQTLQIKDCWRGLEKHTDQSDPVITDQHQSVTVHQDPGHCVTGRHDPVITRSSLPPPPPPPS